MSLRPVCERCGAAMPVPARTQGGGRTKRYCSTRCRVAAHRLRTDPGTLHGAFGTEPANRIRKRQLLYVVPCGAAKLDGPAPARELYVGAHFRFALAAVEAAAARDGARVMILSARHGLVDLDDELAPYDEKLTTVRAAQLSTRDQLVEQLQRVNPARVRVWAPRVYVQALGYACAQLQLPVDDELYGCRGIGDQRHLLAQLATGSA